MNVGPTLTLKRTVLGDFTEYKTGWLFSSKYGFFNNRLDLRCLKYGENKMEGMILKGSCKHLEFMVF